ncbi:MAG: hypothetical protein ACQEVA_10455 [Myxococcota bacterium]
MLAIIVAVIVYLDNSPLQLENDVELAEGVELTREADSDVLIVLDYDAILGSPDTFSERDWSAAWINLFEQEVGPTSIATPESLSSESLESSRIVVLTASVADQIPPDLRARFREHALDGNVLVVERPRGELREMFSANGRAGERAGQRITFAKGLSDPYNSQLLSMPLSTQFVGSTSARTGAETLLSIDGAPAIYSVPIGEGRVVTIDFDLGQQLVALQQGLPSEDFEVLDNERTLPPKTSDLIMSDKLERSAVPHADVLERFIVWGVIGRYAPVASFWQYPGDAQGALVALHEDAVLGDGGGWMLQYESQQKATSTLLTTVDSGLTASGAAVIHRMGGEIGIAWKKAGTPNDINRRVGAWGVNPFGRPLDLATQLDELEQTLPVNYVRSGRIADSWWDERWDWPFRAMAAQDLRIDSSYDPSPNSGYAFGTGFPFLALGRNGLPLGIRELPVVYPAHAVKGPDLEELLKTSRDGHHQTIGWSVDPEMFADYPDMERFELWLEVFELARRHGHIITSATRIDSFQRSRRAGRISSEIVESAQLPGRSKLAKAEDQDDENVGFGTLLRITVESKRRGLSLVIPATMGKREFYSARAGVNRVAGELVSGDIETQSEQITGFDVRRIPLDQGFNTIDVYYR